MALIGFGRAHRQGALSPPRIVCPWAWAATWRAEGFDPAQVREGLTSADLPLGFVGVFTDRKTMSAAAIGLVHIRAEVQVAARATAPSHQLGEAPVSYTGRAGYRTNSRRRCGPRLRSPP